MGFIVIQPARLQLLIPSQQPSLSGSMQALLFPKPGSKMGQRYHFFFPFTDDYENGTEIIFIYRSSLIDNEIIS